MLLSVLWISQILNVLAVGVAVKAYYRAPTVFWWIRIFDIAAVVPLVLLSLHAFVTRRDSSGYAFLLLAVGSLMAAAPVIAGSQIYTLATLPGSVSLIEVLFFSAGTLPVFPCYGYLVKQAITTRGRGTKSP
ncbi:MAG TPA: hypothetical protein VL354_16845 [Spirochaetia bacterium]|nr:hypothetical protein [Spirochaetia bacterium]